MKKFLLTIVSLFHALCYAGQALDPETMQRIQADLADDGRALVIVGLGQTEPAVDLPASAIKSMKSRFLHSPAISESISSLSMQVVDELENLPFIVVSVDSDALDKLLTHSGVTSVEADIPLELH